MSSDFHPRPAASGAFGEMPARTYDGSRGGSEEFRVPGDPQLLEFARDGIDEAWMELRRRHRAVVRQVVAAQGFWLPKRAADRRFEIVRSALRDDDTASEPGDPAVRAVRARLCSPNSSAAYGPEADGVIDVDGEETAGPVSVSMAERRSIALAFGQLPATWQTALWHGVVEDLSDDDVATFTGRRPDEVAGLLVTAENGMIDQYFRVLLGASEDADDAVEERCRDTVALLGAHVRHALSASEQLIVDEHLAGDSLVPPCAACGRRLVIATNVSTTLAASIVPGVTGMSADEYRELTLAADAAEGAAAGADVATDDGTDFHDEPDGSTRRRKLLLNSAIVLLVAVAGVSLFVRPFSSDADQDAQSPTPPGQGAVPGGAADPTVPARDDDGDVDPGSNTLPPIRPEPSAPQTVVELDFGAAEVSGIEGFAAPSVAPASSAQLDVLLRAAGPVVAGGTGTVDVTVRNLGDEPTPVEFAVKLPSGVLVSSAGALDDEGVLTCAPPVGEGFTTCAADIAPGEAETATLRFALERRIVGELVIRPSIGEELVQPIGVHAQLAANVALRGRLVVAGNTVITCSNDDSACLGAQAGLGENLNRWDYPLTAVDVDGRAATETSSSAQIDVGDGVVERALLFWSGDLGDDGSAVSGDSATVLSLPDGADLGSLATTDPVDETEAASVVLTAPGFDPVDVVASRFDRGDVDASEYLAVADVTVLVAAAGSGDYTVADVATSAAPGTYGGWSLVVILADDEAPRRHFLVVNPFAWAAPDFDVVEQLPMPTGDALTTQANIVAFEGEPTFGGETIDFGGVPLGDATSFDSTISGDRDPEFANNFGMDIDTYDVAVDAQAGSTAMRITSTDDGVRIAVLALAVDLPAS